MMISGVKIKGLACDSRQVKKGFAFVAIKGNMRDGSLFIREAVKKGASVVIAEDGPGRRGLCGQARFVTVEDARKFLAEAAAEFYGYPSDRLKVIGITGTNGKTTISYLIEAIAKKSGADCGVIGTINYRFADKQVRAGNTTPGPAQLQGLFSRMLKSGMEYCAMEVSSHALDQNRVLGVNFRQAIFTNLTQDHLDYHKGLGSYFAAKAKLFRMLDPSSCAIINNDDRYGRRIKDIVCCRLVSYGIGNKSTVMARDINFSMNGTGFTLIGPGARARVRTSLVGRYNIYNILAAASWGFSEGLSFRDIKSALENFKSPPGRLEKISSGDARNIFVDYAHTPDALYNVIRALRPLVAGRLVVVFGCGGERDKLKRPKMGRIVSDMADYAVLTSDNPRSEDPSRIIGDILGGIRKDNYRVIEDRRKAIEWVLGHTGRGDCLVIAGKGHEDYQVLKGKVTHFSDREVALRCLKYGK